MLIRRGITVELKMAKKLKTKVRLFGNDFVDQNGIKRQKIEAQ